MVVNYQSYILLCNTSYQSTLYFYYRLVNPSTISFIAISCSNIIIPFYLQDVMKLTPSVTGVLMTVSPIALAIVAPISGYLSDRVGSGSLTFVGLIGTSMGLFLMSFLN